MEKPIIKHEALLKFKVMLRIEHDSATEIMTICFCSTKGDAVAIMNLFRETAPNNFHYSIEDAKPIKIGKREVIN